MEHHELKSKQRVIEHGEVFTPPQLVAQMLGLVSNECERIDSRFLEPACGTGNFLIQILQRKLHVVDRTCRDSHRRWERDAIVALGSLYGIDLLGDNVAECRARLAGAIKTAFESRFPNAASRQLDRTGEFIVSLNIVHGDALTLQTASGAPIVFSEWSPVGTALIKRRDFKFDHLLGHAEIMGSPLFSDLGEDVFLPNSVGDHPPRHYLAICPEEHAS